MEATPASPRVVKEFRFYSESKMATIIFEDDSSDDFTGEENYHKTRLACLGEELPQSAVLQLVDQKGATVVMTVLKGTPHETFEA